MPLKSGAPVKKEAGVSRKAQQEADRLKKEALKKVKPQDLLRTDEYSAWDADGVPTRNKAGEPASKSLIKGRRSRGQAEEAREAANKRKIRFCPPRLAPPSHPASAGSA